ncbi:MAG: hypothetical protein CVU78_03635 [Elusimicrobia bacterium HGW-Elusimicrobia-2]|nr:MAG: hypothetical protein CVU78_03635 [Elusimicrobia bacterium HGW-Elusimicrobia-2]
MYSKEQLEKALMLMGKKLELKKSSHIILVVCGGSSLIISELLSRVTKDVDVVAVGNADKKGVLSFRKSSPLPEIVLKAACEVAHDLGMNEEWLNSGPGDIMKEGLPEGFIQRANQRIYGRKLTVYFLGRYDQVHLKLFAAADQGPGRHVDDLLALNPAEEEIKEASAWALKHDSSEGFRCVLKDMLRKLGYESIAE